MLRSILLTSLTNFGVCVALAHGIMSQSVSAQGISFDLDLPKVGGFIRTAEVEPQLFGQSECLVESADFCTGPAMAAVALEFPDEGSKLVKTLATNLVASSSFLNLRTQGDSPAFNNGSYTANLRAPLPAKVEQPQLAASDGKPQGFDLSIPINSSQSQGIDKSLTASIREKDKAVPFKFQKSYAFLK